MNGQPINQLPIDFTKYAEEKAQGAFKLVHLAEEAFHVVVRNFHQRTGKETTPTVIQTDISGIEQQIGLLDKQIKLMTDQRDGLKALAADMRATATTPQAAK